jgi:hypothetical protein
MKAEVLLQRLQGVQGRGPRWRAICPVHVSKHGSRTLAVFETVEGRVLFKCFAGCGVESICEAIGVKLEDLFPASTYLTDEDRPPRILKPWSPREISQALEVPLTMAWMMLVKVGGGAKLSKAERAACIEASEVCASLIRELAESNYVGH